MIRRKNSVQRLRNKRVRAAVDLPGVPAGTTGRIKLTNGFRWTRHWVVFDNGVEIRLIDDAKLELVDRDGEPADA